MAAEVAWDALATTAAVPPTPLDDTPVDLLVVGMGATGLTAALMAAERGARVVVVDGVGVAAGAAGRNGGFLLAGLADFHHDAVARHGRRVAVAWWRATEEELERTADRLPDHVRRTGSLRIAASDDERDDIARHLYALRDDGIAAESYDGPEGVGLRVPGDAAVNPVDRCRELATACVAAGVLLVAPAHVTGLVPDGAGVRVTTAAADAAAELVAGRVVVAVDGGLERVLPELAGEVRTARLQMLATAPLDRPVATAPVYRRYGLDYLLQAPTGELLLGGGRDLDVEHGMAATTAGHLTTTDVVQEHLGRWVATVAPEAVVTHRWAAPAAFTDTRLPVCAEVRPGVWALGGYSGHGNLIGPMLARRVVAAALDGTSLRFPA